MNKGLKTMDVELSSPSPQKTKTTLITEEILYLRILNSHKMLMLLLIVFHIFIITISTFSSFNNVQFTEESAVCQNAEHIKNGAYIVLNLVLIHFAFQSIRRSKALIANIHFYERHSLILIMGMLLSLLILLFKFVPDFICKNLSISLFNALIMTGHLFVENMLLVMYTKWFVGELRTFGALIN